MLTDKCNQSQLPLCYWLETQGCTCACDNVCNISIAVEYEKLHHHHLKAAARLLVPKGNILNWNVKWLLIHVYIGNMCLRVAFMLCCVVLCLWNTVCICVCACVRACMRVCSCVWDRGIEQAVVRMCLSMVTCLTLWWWETEYGLSCHAHRNMLI